MVWSSFQGELDADQAHCRCLYHVLQKRTLSSIESSRTQVLIKPKSAGGRLKARVLHLASSFFHHVFMPHYQFLIWVKPFRHSRRPNNITQKTFGDSQIHRANFFFRASGSIAVFNLSSKFWRNRIQTLLQDGENESIFIRQSQLLTKY